jgi:pyruvate/2-oxoglutarate dehydrogenase complex dihydrolipoamide dehydrogenase (E3) component
VEKENHLGGAATLGSVNNSKKEFSAMTEYLRRQLKKLNVEVRLGEYIDPSNFRGDIEGSRYDEIIVATGSKPTVPLAKSPMHHYRVCMAAEILAKPQDAGQNVYVIGGGSVAMEVAEYLCGLGKNVTVIEMTDRICADLGPLNRADLLERVERLPIRILLNTRIIALNDDGLIVSKEGKEEKLGESSTVVVAMGVEPAPLTLAGMRIPVHYIGDCRNIGNALDAIHDAFNAAISL